MSDENQKIAKYISDGHKILDEKYWNDWDKCVPIRVNDIYGGMELGRSEEHTSELQSH